MTLRRMIVVGALALTGPWACVPTGLEDEVGEDWEDAPCTAWREAEAGQAEALDAWREHALVLEALGCEGWLLEVQDSEAPIRRAPPIDLVEREV